MKIHSTQHSHMMSRNYNNSIKTQGKIILYTYQDFMTCQWRLRCPAQRNTVPLAHRGAFGGDAGDKPYWHSPHLPTMHGWLAGLYNCSFLFSCSSFPQLPILFLFNPSIHPRSILRILLFNFFLTFKWAPQIHPRNISSLCPLSHP